MVHDAAGRVNRRVSILSQFVPLRNVSDIDILITFGPVPPKGDMGLFFGARDFETMMSVPSANPIFNLLGAVVTMPA
jgi:hypothetical protein